MPNLNLLDLPAEILTEIFYLSTEPALIHTCHRTWKELPSFVWYSQRLAALALYKPTPYQELGADGQEKIYGIELYEQYKLPEIHAVLSQGERIELQSRLFSSPWFGKKHFIRTLKVITFSLVQEVILLQGIDANDKKLTALYRYINSCFGDECLVPNEFFVTCFKVDDYSVRVVFNDALWLRVFGYHRHISDETNVPRKGEYQYIKAHALDVPVLPAALIESVANYDKRGFDLLTTLYAMMLGSHYFNKVFPLTTEIMTTIETCIKRLLRSSNIHPLDPEDEHLKLLLLFDAAKYSRFLEGHWGEGRRYNVRFACDHQKKTALEESSIYIREYYYERVIGERNVEGFKRLLRLNPAVCVPPSSFFLSRFDALGYAQDARLQEQRALYIEAWEKKEAARRVLYKSREGIPDESSIAERKISKMQRSIWDYVSYSAEFHQMVLLQNESDP